MRPVGRERLSMWIVAVHRAGHAWFGSRGYWTLARSCSLRGRGKGKRDTDALHEYTEWWARPLLDLIAS